MPTSLPLVPRPIPLTELDNGTLRVTGTRIPLERVVEEWLNGATPEQIIDSYDTLRLADVYALIAFYLDNKEAVEAYMREQDRKGDEVRRMIEAAQPPRTVTREVLLERWARREAKNASAGD